MSINDFEIIKKLGKLQMDNQSNDAVVNNNIIFVPCRQWHIQRGLQSQSEDRLKNICPQESLIGPTLSQRTIKCSE